MQYFKQRMILGWVAIISFILADEVMPRFFEDELFFGGPSIVVWAHTVLMVIAVVCGIYAVFGPMKIRVYARDFAQTLDRFFS